METVPSRDQSPPETTVVLTRQPPVPPPQKVPPRPAPRVDFGVSLPFVPPRRDPKPSVAPRGNVDLGTSIPLVLPVPGEPKAPPPGYCDDPRFADTELCYRGGVPASQGRPSLAVPVPFGFQSVPSVATPPRSEKSIAKSAGALMGLGGASPSRPVVGATVVQTAPARGFNPAGDGLPVSQFVPQRNIVPAGIVGIPVARFRATGGPSVSQYRPAGGARDTEAGCRADRGTWDADLRACLGGGEGADGEGGEGADGEGGEGAGGKPGSEGADHTDAYLRAASSAIGAIGLTITRILDLENRRIQGRLDTESNQALELARINARRDLATAQGALDDARSQGANDGALQALSAQLAALQAQAQNAGVQVGMSTPVKIGLAVGGVAVVGGLAFLLARRGGWSRDNPSRGASSRRHARRNGRKGGRR